MLGERAMYAEADPVAEGVGEAVRLIGAAYIVVNPSLCRELSGQVGKRKPNEKEEVNVCVCKWREQRGERLLLYTLHPLKGRYRGDVSISRHAAATCLAGAMAVASYQYQIYFDQQCLEISGSGLVRRYPPTSIELAWSESDMQNASDIINNLAPNATVMQAVCFY